MSTDICGVGTKSRFSPYAVTLIVLGIFIAVLCSAFAVTNESTADSSDGTYTVSFVYGEYTTTYPAQYGETVTLPPMIPLKEPAEGKAYSFSNWEGYSEGMKVYSDLTFTAVFNEIDAHCVTIIYDDDSVEYVYVTDGKTIDEPRAVFGYYYDADMTQSWSPLTKIFNDRTVYAKVAVSGYAGDEVVWAFDRSTGTLTLSGIGSTYDWSAKDVPWYSLKSYISSLVIEEGITYLGNYAFYKYTNLSNITLPDSLVGTGKYAIVTSAAEHIKIGSGLKALGMRGLYGMEFYEGTEPLDAKDFNLRSKEFYGTSGILYLDSISGTANEVSWTIDYSTKTLTVYGKGSAGNWTATSAPWYSFKGYFENIVVEKGVTEIGDFSFYAYTGVKTIILGNDVARIGTNSLRGCSGLTEIVFGEELTSIGSNALTGYTFYKDGKTVKSTAANLSGRVFVGTGDKTFDYVGIAPADESLPEVPDSDSGYTVSFVYG